MVRAHVGAWHFSDLTCRADDVRSRGQNGHHVARPARPSMTHNGPQFAVLIWTLTVAGQVALANKLQRRAKTSRAAVLSSAKNREKPTCHRSRYRPQASSHFRPFPKPQHTSRSLPAVSSP